jgi:hypothetical protein
MVITVWSDGLLVFILHLFTDVNVTQAFLDCSKEFGPEHHVIDVANILKMFFRELPEPLIPHTYHDVLLR